MGTGSIMPADVWLEELHASYTPLMRSRRLEEGELKTHSLAV